MAAQGPLLPGSTAPSTSAANTSDFGQFAKLRAGARDHNPETIRQVARQFESLFTQMLLKASHGEDSSHNDLLGGSSSDTYRDLYDQQMAAQLSSGKGLGLAELLTRQLQGLAAAPEMSAEDIATLRKPDSAGLALPAAAHPAAAQSSGAGKASPAAATSASADAFVDEITPHAERAAKELGVPARVLVAQAALETGWGQKSIRNADGSNSHNLFGIKADKAWTGASTSTTTHEYRNGEKTSEQAAFRSYGSVGEAFDDYVRFVKDNPRYAAALRHGGDGSRYAQGLQKAGYATDPAYASKIARIAYGRTMTASLDVTPAAARASATRTWET